LGYIKSHEVSREASHEISRAAQSVERIAQPFGRIALKRVTYMIEATTRATR
jgi:hypothetical protein